VYDLPGLFDCPGVAFFPTIIKTYAVRQEACPKIFLARRGARALTNHAAVELLTAAYGYETIYMETTRLHSSSRLEQGPRMSLPSTAPLWRT
jgi:hypothetical protein